MKNIHTFEDFLNESVNEVSDSASSIDESLLKITPAGGLLGEQKPGTVDTKLIDELLKQIGPHIGYADWKAKIKNPDYKGIIQKIAKHISGVGTLGSDRLDIE